MRKMLGAALVGATLVAMAQPAAAQECRTAPYSVYFEAGRDEITPDAAQMLDEAAKAYIACGTPQAVTISGYTDRHGADAANVGLSQRMASNVRAYLAGRGVPDGVMTVQAFGENRLALETADGMAEPLNRRVEITFGPGSGW